MITGAVLIAVIVVGAVLLSPSTPVSLPPPVTILPSGEVFQVPESGYVVDGPVDLMNSAHWIVNESFSVAQNGSVPVMDLFTLNSTQYQTWNHSARGLPAEYNLALENTMGGTGYAGLDTGTYYFLWMNTGTQGPSTITIKTFEAKAVLEFPPPPGS